MITHEILIAQGFKQYDDGDYWRETFSHKIQIIASRGEWYPAIFKGNNFVLLHRIKFEYEIENLISFTEL